MKHVRVWDLFVRLFHWSLVILFVANAFFIDDDSKLHIYVGYAVAILIALRIIWGFVGSRYARFSAFIPSRAGVEEQLREMAGKAKKSIHIGHTPLGALMIFNLLISIVGICITGYLMTTDQFWGEEWPEELHEFFVTWTEISVVLHIAAVFFESWRTRINLPRAMISGYKDIPDNQDDGHEARKATQTR